MHKAQSSSGSKEQPVMRRRVTAVILPVQRFVYTNEQSRSVMVDMLEQAIPFSSLRHDSVVRGHTIPLGRRGDAIRELDDIDTLVKTYRPRLLRFVTFSTGDPDMAETIVQDCLLKAYNARERFRGESSVNTFLTSIALNLIRDHQRTKKFRFWKTARATAIDVSDVASFVRSNETSPEASLLAKEQVARLSGILEALSLNQRTVFLMKFSDEMDLQQISEAMNMPLNTVKTHLHRALKSVRSHWGARP